MSVSTISNGTRNYRRSRKSIISLESDIRFTRTKLTSQCRCACYLLTAFLLLLLVAAAAVYIGYSYFVPEDPVTQFFRGTFKITDGDRFTSDLADPKSNIFKTKARDYRELLNILFRRSLIKNGFMGTEILALDGTEDTDLIIHFALEVDPTYIEVSSNDIERIIHNDWHSENPIVFKNLKIEPNSIKVTPNNIVNQKPSLLPSTIAYEAITQTPEPPRSCTPVTLPFCSKVKYNLTSYPNFFKHKNVEEVGMELIPFREVVDAECYDHAYEFVCNVLQPQCKKQDEIVLPCKSFCKYFMNGCGNRLPENLKKAFNCSKLENYANGGKCLVEPDCGRQLNFDIPNRVLTKSAKPGDWPWYTTLFKENTHTCDGTLIDPSWVATTSSCFQGQPKAEWTVRLGNVHLTKPSSRQQERRIVGMVKSPVEGSTIALVKLDSPIVINDFVRPICLPKSNSDVIKSSECNTLGWARTSEQLKRIQVKVAAMEKCENTSISTMNSFCTENSYGQESCHEEEFAGTPVMCLNEESQTWSIVGITNWRIACSKKTMLRPRMYDKISSNVNWIRETITAT